MAKNSWRNIDIDGNIIASGIINKPEYPIQIDGVFNIWYTF